MSQTVLAFDFGTNSIGCAVGQSITGTAQGLPAFKAQDGIPNWEQIGKVIAQWQPDLLVVGLPLNMDGTEQPLTQRAKKFANRLNGRFNLPVELQDERLTTVEAKSEIFARGGFKALKKGKVDAISACLILESWFEQQS
ncbi:Holliday junction resolvase RuvX [Glaesserella parasuis]|uniref:Putative pre-16S rRNA nuclease n=3 Tax=Glaesserella parasuis TaxID=738 RepID=YQGF_GLAP5|nr:Holliday junction resolvase RuvX [Glaesserella parasuis]B8F5F8.1 RecName: Full=Putative pre-16S rRNA nuclease [Glaesserella parasuis SH0165]AGO15651.1 Holliday junction resolvase-like protein [Glaesserella parasuis ZJ0906]ACL32560.1 holliday junction resolvase-like protein/crossover junction endodeoxyribonuclease [Glaesserella parasuis SH0165]AMW17263.1 crossover junction endodeoxyribonuclease RuvA [Glaesserella parasuis]ATW45015.1 Holliday junction DNA helicase RuvA [Glaesserella parasuis 